MTFINDFLRNYTTLLSILKNFYDKMTNIKPKLILHVKYSTCCKAQSRCL